MIIALDSWGYVYTLQQPGDGDQHRPGVSQQFQQCLGPAYPRLILVLDGGRVKDRARHDYKAWPRRTMVHKLVSW